MSAPLIAPPEVVKKCEAAWVKLQMTLTDNCFSLLRKHYTKEILDACKDKKTKLGASLMDVIQSGIDNLDSEVGVYAPDAEAYTVFAALFNPIIQYHNFAPDAKQPAVDFDESKMNQLADLDPNGEYINSTRIRCARNLQRYPLNPMMTLHSYVDAESKIKKALVGLKDTDLQGTYHAIEGMKSDVRATLIEQHILFKSGDRFMQKANACRHWPSGRGIYYNKAKTFLVWVNEEDHLRIVSMQKGGNIAATLARLIKGIKAIEEKESFARDERLGYITCCPTNLGTTIRASVHVKLPKLSAKPGFDKICAGLKLEVRGVHGEHTESVGGVYDISNKRRLGLTEFEAVMEMYDGVKKLIELEKAA